MFIQNLCDGGPINNHSCFPLRRLDRIPRLEDSRQLLEGAFTSLHEQEIDHNKLQRIPEDEKKVILPSSVREGHFGYEGIVEAGDVDEDLSRPISMVND